MPVRVPSQLWRLRVDQAQIVTEDRRGMDRLAGRWQGAEQLQLIALRRRHGRLHGLLGIAAGGRGLLRPCRRRQHQTSRQSCRQVIHAATLQEKLMRWIESLSNDALSLAPKVV